MKNFIISLIVFLLFTGLTGCHNLIQNDDSVVEKIELASNNKQYKYRVFIRAFPVSQILYTNTPFQVGDTVKYSR